MTAGRLVVAVVAGGPSPEAAVSRTSARAVRDALSQCGHSAMVLELHESLSETLLGGRFDVVFPITHGPLGEDGCLQGMLEVLGFPYVGSGVLASALGLSKPHAKIVFRAASLPVADDVVISAGDDLEDGARLVRERLGRAVVVKPASGGSAIGIERLGESDEDAALVASLRKALTLEATVLVERFEPGLEVTCGVLEDDEGQPRALPPTLILPRAADWYDFRSRYAAGGSEHRCPAPFSPELTARIQRIAERAHRALGARDMSRADFVVNESARERAVTLLEVNTLPGMTPTSLFPEAAAISGLPFATMCDRLVRRAHARPTRPAVHAVPMPDTD